MPMTPDSRIFVAGQRGLVGSALIRTLRAKGYDTLLTPSSAELDLTDQQAVGHFFEQEKPEYVFLAAAKVGGIHANHTQRAQFIYENLMIECNVIHAAHRVKAQKLLFLGSSCIYPKHAPQPLKEEYLLTGPLEKTNHSYAIAKIAGIELCQAYRAQYGSPFICAMPTNLYGPNDNFDLENSHVLPALIRKFHTAKVNDQSWVEIWGTGTPRREFLHVDDLAEACLFLMHHYDASDIINIGTGQDLSILQLAELIQQVVGYQGELRFDPSKPDGTPRKLLDVSRIQAMGFTPKISLAEGIESVYAQFSQAMAQPV